MQTHENSNHGLREEFLNALRATATNNTYMVSWAFTSEAEKKAWWAVVRKLAATVVAGLEETENKTEIGK